MAIINSSGRTNWICVPPAWHNPLLVIGDGNLLVITNDWCIYRLVLHDRDSSSHNGQRNKNGPLPQRERMSQLLAGQQLQLEFIKRGPRAYSGYTHTQSAIRYPFYISFIAAAVV